MNAPSRMVRAGMAPLALALLLAGCERNPLIVNRSACPAVAVAAHVGDITLFRGAGTDAADIDTVAAITNVREECTETAEQFVTRITFDVVARRSDMADARQISLPVFAAVVQHGSMSGAARALGMSTSAVSQQVRKLDQIDTDPAARKDARIVEVEVRLDDSAAAAALTNLQVEVVIGRRAAR